MSESKQTVTFKLGDTVTYETVDMEYYSRGYGLSYETKASTIVAICYKMANGDLMEGSKLLLVESKSDPTKNPQNGSTG
jgi:hypothetical protein